MTPPVTDQTDPPYTDRCPDCPVRTVVPPLVVRSATNGQGVVADYACPQGHTWTTCWVWWSDRPHRTDEAAA